MAINASPRKKISEWNQILLWLQILQGVEKVMILMLCWKWVQKGFVHGMENESIRLHSAFSPRTPSSSLRVSSPDLTSFPYDEIVEIKTIARGTASPLSTELSAHLQWPRYFPWSVSLSLSKCLSTKKVNSGFVLWLDGICLVKLFKLSLGYRLELQCTEK